MGVVLVWFMLVLFLEFVFVCSFIFLLLLLGVVVVGSYRSAVDVFAVLWLVVVVLGNCCRL